MQNSDLHRRLNEVEEIVSISIFENNRESSARTKELSSRPSSNSLRGPERTVSQSQFPNPLQNSPSVPRAIEDHNLTKHKSMIHDNDGRQFWEKSFGEVLMVEWDKFIDIIRARFKGQINDAEITQLRGILDHSDTGYLSQYKFSEFLKGFGPFDMCVANVKSLLQQLWFHGFLSSRESELLMTVGGEPDGTFLIRFSKSKPGSFALAFVKGRTVKHILIESSMPEGFHISDAATGSIKRFKSLQEIIDHYHFVLKHPFISDLPKKVWFHGDLSNEEAKDLLTDQEKGTYLIRFSSRSCFAASFVDSKDQVRHVLITNEGKDFQVNTGEGELINFKSIKELVTYYKKKGVFKQPLKTTNQ